MHQAHDVSRQEIGILAKAASTFRLFCVVGALLPRNTSATLSFETKTARPLLAWPSLQQANEVAANDVGVAVAWKQSSPVMQPYFGPMLPEDLVETQQPPVLPGSAILASPLNLLDIGQAAMRPEPKAAPIDFSGGIRDDKLSHEAATMADLSKIMLLENRIASNSTADKTASLDHHIGKVSGVERIDDSVPRGGSATVLLTGETVQSSRAPRRREVPRSAVSKAGFAKDDEHDSDIATAAQGLMVMACGSVGVWAVLVTLVALLYERTKPHPPVLVPGEWFIQMGYWNFHIFQCLHELRLVIFTCWCGPIRWADTQRMAKFLTFWQAYALVMVLTVLSMCGVVICAPIILAISVYYRQKMRAMFEIPHGDCLTITSDCCAYAFCSVCAMVQEARQIEMAYLARHPINPPPNQTLADHV